MFYTGVNLGTLYVRWKGADGGTGLHVPPGWLHQGLYWDDLTSQNFTFFSNYCQLEFRPVCQVGVYSVVELGNTTRLFFVPSSHCYALGLAFVQKVIDILRKEKEEKDEALDLMFERQCLNPTERPTTEQTSTPGMETKSVGTTSARPETPQSRSSPIPDLHLLPASSPPSTATVPDYLVYILLALIAILSILLILVTFILCSQMCHRESETKPPHFLVMQVGPSPPSQLTQFSHQVQPFPQVLSLGNFTDLSRQDFRPETATSSAKHNSYGYLEWNNSCRDRQK